MIYLPEIKYRRILNQAFGPGGWAIMPRGETLNFQVLFCVTGRDLLFLVLMSVGMSAVSGDRGGSADNTRVCPLLSESVCGTGHRRTHFLQQEQPQLWQGM